MRLYVPGNQVPFQDRVLMPQRQAVGQGLRMETVQGSDGLSVMYAAMTGLK